MSAPVNGYIVLADIQESLRAGGSANPSTLTANVPDDNDIQDYIFQASRAIDTYTRRWFYPRRQTRLYDRPNNWWLIFDADALEMIEVVNGNNTVITATPPPAQYVLYNPNYSPYYKLQLVPTTGVVWQLDSTGNYLNVIRVDALWGYHDDYTNAYSVATAINNGGGYGPTDTTFDVDSNSALQVGQTIRLGALATSEYCRVETVPSATQITVTRSVNGSAVASVPDDTPIYIYRPMGLIQYVTRMMVLDIYRKRTGQMGTSTSVEITSSGVVLRPEGLPKETADAINALRASQR